MDIVQKKRDHSIDRIRALSEKVNSDDVFTLIPSLTVFAAGSYAREEASEHSDIDLFFVADGELSEIDDLKISSLRMFAKLIEISDSLRFPKFSNDGQYLEIISVDDLILNLGGVKDDSENYFTTRMLMLLESKPIFNEDQFRSYTRRVIRRYFADYKHHPKDFRPVFLVNDIIRFWKTLCLNYENKRNKPTDSPSRKVKQKIKNFKLKYSRMLTCFATIAAIISVKDGFNEQKLNEIVGLTPSKRLHFTADHLPICRPHVERIMQDYQWFLQTTDVSEETLTSNFHDTEFVRCAFAKADAFGDSVYQLIYEVAAETGYLRYLLV